MNRALALLLAIAPTTALAQPLELLPVVPVHTYAWLEPPDPSFPTHVIPLSEITPPERSTPAPRPAMAPSSCGAHFRPEVRVGGQRPHTETFTVVDTRGAMIVHSRAVWQMGWERRDERTWREVVPLPRDRRPSPRAIALRGAHAALRLLDIPRSSTWIVRSDAEDLRTCIGPSSAVARRFGVTSGPVHVACYERGFVTVHGETTDARVLQHGRVLRTITRPFHLIDTPAGPSLLIEQEPDRWRIEPLR